MLTRDDLDRLYAFGRASHTVGSEVAILNTMGLSFSAWNETLVRLEETKDQDRDGAPKPGEPFYLIRMAAKVNRDTEREDADQRARIAKLNYDAARAVGMPNPEAFALAVEAVRQECGR